MAHRLCVCVLLVGCGLLLASPGQAQEGQDLAERLGLLPGELLKAKMSDAQIVETLYLTTLARLPKEEERFRALQALEKANPRDKGGRDLLWTLVTGKEFTEMRGFHKNQEEGTKFTQKVQKALERR